MGTNILTIGQRIAQCRKARGLSQEALGAQLGVSRQSIYKWEQDAALPEIDKLIALSRLFGLSVGELLGVEEAAQESGTPLDEEAIRRHQQALAEEIASRYSAVQPKKRPKWLIPALCALGLAVIILFSNLFSRLDELNRRYNELHNSVSSIRATVSGEISGISEQVQSILKAQSDLTADWSIEHLAVDPIANTVTFRLRVVPKTYEDGMQVYFLADAGTGETAEIESGSDGTVFEDEITCPLSDTITISAAFERAGVRETQKLQTYYSLLAETMPFVDVREFLSWPLRELPTPIEGFVLLKTSDKSEAANKSGVPRAEIAELRIGLFVNQKLLYWAEPYEGKPPSIHGATNGSFYRFADTRLYGHVEAGDIVSIAAVVTDTFGRTLIRESFPCYVVTEENGAFDLDYPGYYESTQDGWEY